MPSAQLRPSGSTWGERLYRALTLKHHQWVGGKELTIKKFQHLCVCVCLCSSVCVSVYVFVCLCVCVEESERMEDKHMLSSAPLRVLQGYQRSH